MDQKLILSAAAIASTVIVVCASDLLLRKKKRRLWVRKLFQRRLTLRSYPTLVRELRDEDPEAFRGYLRMDVETFDALLDMVEDRITLSSRVRRPIPARERLAVTLRYLATDIICGHAHIDSDSLIGYRMLKGF